MASSFSDTVLRLLLSCAEAIEDGDLKSADGFLHSILILAGESCYSDQRLVKYFADALVRRAYGLHPACSSFTFLVDPAAYYHSICYLINGVIENVIHDALMGIRRFHLIDFSIPYYYSFGNSVVRTLPTFSGEPLPVRVSYILPPFLKKYVKFSRQMEFLTRDAKEVNVKLEDELKVVYGNSLAEVDECEIDLKRRRDDEMVVVYYKFKLEKLVRDAKAMERELVRLKEINPTIVIMLDFYSNHAHSNFLTCFKDSFQYSLKTFEYYWEELDHYIDGKYGWECNREVGEGNNIIRRHPTLTEWQHLFSRAGFSRIPLNHKKDNLSVEDERWLEIMGEEEECLILGNEGCPMFFLSAWKPKVEDGHFNSISTNHKFGQGFDPNPAPLQPRQPFLEGLKLNRLAALAEIHDISKYLSCKYKLSLTLTLASKVNNMNETISDPNKKHVFFIQDNYCYTNDMTSYYFMLDYSKDMISGRPLIIEKAFESRDGYHFQPSLSKVEDYRDSTLQRYNIDGAVAICLQNRHTSDEVYIVEFYWPPTESEISKSLALRIFDDLKHMKTTFVTVKVQVPEIKLQEAISSIPTSANTAMPLKIAENAHIEQVVADPFNTLEGPYNKIVETKRNKQRKSWSKVWVDFDKFEEHGKQVAKCKHCPKVFTGSSKSGTTHLNNHSKVCPGKKKPNQESQLILPVDTNERSSTFDQERSHLDLVKMVIKHQYPLALVGQEAFKNFVKGLQPMFEFQSRDKLLSDFYKEKKREVRQGFDKLACKFNLRVTLWKNGLGKTAYCCLIAHFIDDDWKLKMKILAFKTLKHIYDTKALSEIIQRSVSEWNLDEKIYSITMDDPSLNEEMFQQIKETCVRDQGSLSSAHWFISCNFLEDGSREMYSILHKFRESIEYVTETTHGRLKFQEAVDQVKLQGGKSLDDLSFKLESEFDILTSALKSREIFCQLEQIDGNFKLNPSMEEWEKAIALKSCLKCFNDIKGTQSISVSLYFPMLCDIYKKFLQLEKSNHSFLTLMKRKFDRYWSLCNLELAVASVLDPRLKFKIVELSYNVIYGHDNKMQLNEFHKVLTDVYWKYTNGARNSIASTSILGDSNSLTTETANDCILDSFNNFLPSWKSELEDYLGESEPALPLDGDILGWWRANSLRLPSLAKMARDHLAMLVSVSMPCSAVSAMITHSSYNRLDPDSMEALVCSQNWLETLKENEGENHELTQNTEKRKRKMDEEDTYVVKSFKPLNCEKANSTKDIAKDSNNNEELQIVKSCKNWCKEETDSGNKYKAANKMNVGKEVISSKSSELNLGRNTNDVIEILSEDTSIDTTQLDQVESSSSESDNETTLKDQGSWCEQDVEAYLLSRFTSKEHKRLDKWQKKCERNELNGKMIGRDVEFKLMSNELAPLFMVPQDDETREEYYINDSVVNVFLNCLRRDPINFQMHTSITIHLALI
ncbi:uncharacterized protein LOC105784864 isoform X4 [Gossypium raimondii]|uniref:uncharacterized protein LOC105784864 isoform X4 n=1 Tax=Gossypium raimondii TaxID=29730 RepID=UPI00227D252C|nr:uncharacterized protein LOC105784864 isoform X4 [Gossypium raimondii]